MEAKVSVVIPLHNAEVWIGETLESVRSSIGVHSEEVEVVVVDDGSTDGGLKIAQGILASMSNPTQMVRLECSGGAAVARNAGWRQAKGQWIRFLDADDLVAPHALRLHLDAAELNPSAAVIYSEWARLVIHKGQWRQARSETSVLEDDVVSSLLRSDVFIATGSSLIKRSCLEKSGGYREGMKNVQDVALLQDIAIQGGEFVYVPSELPVLLYRQHPGSLSRRSAHSFALGCLVKAEVAQRFFESDGWSPDRQQRLRDALFFCARALAPLDGDAFERAVQALERMDRTPLPDGPPSLRQLSRAIGYRRAERVSIAYRQWKARLLRAVNS